MQSSTSMWASGGRPLLVASLLCFRSEMPLPAPLSRCLFHTTFAEAAEPKGKATRDPQVSLDPDTHMGSPCQWKPLSRQDSIAAAGITECSDFWFPFHRVPPCRARV